MSMGTLYIVSTPIGNIDDITIRAIKTIFLVDYIVCEDTRRTGQLISMYESKLRKKELVIQDLNLFKKPKCISFYDEVEEVKVPEIVRLLEEGNSIALISDAGTPLLSDPGYKLVLRCIHKEIPIIPVPGASSILTALVLSGLPVNNVLFTGFLPQKKSKRISFLKQFVHAVPGKFNTTILSFESPHRLYNTLTDIQTILGDIDIVIARELTKIHEEVLRGKISILIPKLDTLKGELVLLFSV